jgi:DNA repair exonuclease SbcCD ATPase subunit
MDTNMEREKASGIIIKGADLACAGIAPSTNGRLETVCEAFGSNAAASESDNMESDAFASREAWAESRQDHVLNLVRHEIRRAEVRLNVQLSSLIHKHATAASSLVPAAVASSAGLVEEVAQLLKLKTAACDTAQASLRQELAMVRGTVQGLQDEVHYFHGKYALHDEQLSELQSSLRQVRSQVVGHDLLLKQAELVQHHTKPLGISAAAKSEAGSAADVAELKRKTDNHEHLQSEIVSQEHQLGELQARLVAINAQLDYAVHMFDEQSGRLEGLVAAVAGHDQLHLKHSELAQQHSKQLEISAGAKSEADSIADLAELRRKINDHEGFRSRIAGMEHQFSELHERLRAVDAHLGDAVDKFDEHSGHLEHMVESVSRFLQAHTNYLTNAALGKREDGSQTRLTHSS